MAEWHRIITSPYTGSMSMSGSFNVDGDATITGNVTINGTASVENLIVKQIGYSSGSNQLGDAANDTQTLYGSVIIPTGSLTVTGSLNLKSTTSNTATLLTLQVSESSASTLAFTDKVPKLTLISNTEGPSALGTGPDYLLELNKTGASGGPRVGIRIISSGTNTSVESYRSVTTGVVNYISTGIINGSTEVLTVAGNLNVGINNTDPTAKLAIKGSGTTSSTTAFLVQNANASASLIVRDDQNVEIQGGLAVTGVTGSWIIEARGTSNSGGIRRVGNNVEFFGLNYVGGFIGGYGTLNIRGYSGGSTGNTTTSAATIADTFNYNASSANTPGLTISPAINQTGTGTFTLLNFSPTINTTGSGISYYISSSNYVVTSLGNVGIKTSTPSASLHVVGNTILSGSAGTGSALTVYKSGSTVVDVQGSSGQLFSVTDSLSGSLFSVNTAAGLPTIEAFSDNTVNIGKFGTYPIKVVSLGTSAVVSGSFSGSGADLSGIPASAIVGLNLSQIATGSVTASVGLGTGSFSIVSGSSNFFFVSSSGNIGIGTTATTDKLTVNGSIAFSSYNNTIGSGTYPATAVYSGALIGATTISDGGGAGIKFTDSGGSAYAKMGFGNLNTTIGQSSYGVVPDLGARLGVRGAGTTSSTTTFLVQNANASASLEIKDDRSVIISGILTANSSSTIAGPLTVNYGSIVGGTSIYANGNTQHNQGRGIYATGYAYGIQANQTMVGNWGNQPNAAGVYGTGQIGVYGSGSIAGFSGPSAFFTSLSGNSRVNARVTSSLVQITGYGSDLATTALLVQNSNASASLSVLDNGNVGIGTTTPSYTLDVSGSGNFTDGLTVTGSLNVTSALTASSAIISGNVTVLGTASINTLIVNQTQLSTGSNQLGDAADDFQTLYGTVRIPTGSLTVTGSTNISGSFTVAGRGNTNIGDIGYSTINLNGGVNVANTGPNTGTSLTVSGGGNTAMRFDWDNINNVTTVVSSASRILRFTGASQYQVRGSGATSSTTALLVQNSNASSSLAVLDNGNVGIGTASPNAKLDIRINQANTTTVPYLNLLNDASGYVGYTFSKVGSNDLGLYNNYAVPPAMVWKYVSGTNSYVGINTASPAYTLDVSGSGNFTNNLTVTGSFTVVTGSTVEFQVNQTGVKIGNATTDSHSITGSLAISASAGTGSALTVYKSGSTVMSIQGSQGELFSITDSLSGSLFSVSNVSGLPILEVFSDNTTLVGDYLAPALITTKRMTVNSGSTVIYSLPTASYDGAFFDYTIKSGSNARAGSIFGTYISTTASYTDTSTFDIGDTTGVAFALIVSGSNMVLTGSASTSGWALKTIIRSI